MASTYTPILIVGAGISGLTLAQALLKEGIPFQIVEQDDSLLSRGAGWGLTIHWALPAFLDLLPQELQERLPETYVNKEAVNKGEIGNFAFYDLNSGEWSKRLANLNIYDESMSAHFDDGTSCMADLVVGCDGIYSSVRRTCFPSSYQNYELPIRMLGVGVPYSTSQVEKIRELDPFFLHGSDPRSDAYLWFSCMSP
ncbi:hypothetical protein MMC12_001797 [Toensbergia leucococca]|nr:hypothetical protein [Toensbergia leucococca]